MKYLINPPRDAFTTRLYSQNRAFRYHGYSTPGQVQPGNAFEIRRKEGFTYMALPSTLRSTYRIARRNGMTAMAARLIIWAVLFEATMASVECQFISGSLLCGESDELSTQMA